MKNKIIQEDIHGIGQSEPKLNVFRNSIKLVLSNGCSAEYWIRWLNYIGLQIPHGTFFDYYEDNEWKSHYIVRYSNWETLDFSGDNLDDIRNRCRDSIYKDIRESPDGTKWVYKKFLYDAINWDLHWCYLQKLDKKNIKTQVNKGYSNTKKTYYFNPDKKGKNRK